MSSGLIVLWGLDNQFLGNRVDTSPTCLVLRMTEMVQSMGTLSGRIGRYYGNAEDAREEKREGSYTFLPCLEECGLLKCFIEKTWIE